jgi:hypothetical protein
MRVKRRHILWLLGGGILSRLAAASLPGFDRNCSFDVDRLLCGGRPGDATAVTYRKYSASAAVTLFSVPIASKNAVGSGYAVVEEALAATGRILSIQFGAGSYPESARGLNRLGFIQEVIAEDRPGHAAECAWLAFMTTSKEKNLDEVRRVAETTDASVTVAYTASQGYGRNGCFASRVDRLEFPRSRTWRDISQLVESARRIIDAGLPTPSNAAGASSDATFLYCVRRAMLDPAPHTTSFLAFNNKRFQLDVHKEPDAQATFWFASRKLVTASSTVLRMNALLTEKHAGEKTPFRIWYEAGAEHPLPLRFEYQARSYLRLTFEADATAATPPMQLVFQDAHNGLTRGEGAW